ncbi:MAG: hypothetical protein ACYDD1_19925 [Caulobacteraceae bacterium]
MRLALSLIAALAVTGAARAQTPTDIALAAAPSSQPNISVETGQALQLKSGDFGPEAVTELTNDLASTVGKALAHSHNGAPVRVKLVLEDASPTRPTIAQLGRVPGMSERSIGLGGAWIDGYVLTADNKQLPISYSFYQTNLRDELAPSMWSDANRAFEQLADQLARGKYPKEAPPDAPQQSFAHWPR